MRTADRKRPAETDQLSTFTWRVYRDGYTWVRDVDPSLGPELDLYALTSGVDEQTERRTSAQYEPSKVEPGLFRTFANTVPSRKDILEFANQYGLLGGTIESRDIYRIAIAGKPEVFRRTERFRAWATEILFMRTIVELWTAVQDRDRRSIRKFIVWERQRAIFQSGHPGTSLSLPSAPLRASEANDSSPAPWVAELDSEFQKLKVRGWVVHPNRDSPELVKYLQSKWIEAALYFIQVVVNRKLVEHAIESPRLNWVSHERLGWQYVPSSLIGLMWLQFADAISANRKYKACLQCRKWFEVAQSAGRADKLYCSQSCRIRNYRSRQAEVRELYSLGATVEELAKRFNSDSKTIRAWLAHLDSKAAKRKRSGKVDQTR